MKPSIFTSFDYDNIPFGQAVELIRNSGFECLSLGAKTGHSGYGTAAGRNKIKSLINLSGMRIDTVHAPFPEGDNLFSLDESQRVESVRQCKLALDAAYFLNASLVAVHLIPYGITDSKIERKMVAKGVASIGDLSEYARAIEVKLALENGQRPRYDRVLEFLLDEFREDTVGLCYDSGHENVQDKCFQLLEKHASRLQCVHIHDNLGSDKHMLPFDGNIDWRRFRSVFHKIKFNGNLLLEVKFNNAVFKNHETFLAEARKRALSLIERL